MTPEELLKPRYKVIADYPSNTFNVGQVLVQSDIVEDWLQTDNFLHGFKLSGAKKYPHLFEPLPWYAERKPEDMPEHLNFLGLNTPPAKVIKYHSLRQVDIELADGRKITSLDLSDFLPATKEEWESYINSKA